MDIKKNSWLIVVNNDKYILNYGIFQDPKYHVSAHFAWKLLQETLARLQIWHFFGRDPSVVHALAL